MARLLCHHKYPTKLRGSSSHMTKPTSTTRKKPFVAPRIERKDSLKSVTAFISGQQPE